jgi:hypothetical protein
MIGGIQAGAVVPEAEVEVVDFHLPRRLSLVPCSLLPLAFVFDILVH